MEIRFEYDTHKDNGKALSLKEYLACPMHTEIYDIVLSPKEISVNGWVMPIRQCSNEWTYRLRDKHVLAGVTFFDGHTFKPPFEIFGRAICKHVIKHGIRKN